MLLLAFTNYSHISDSLIPLVINLEPLSLAHKLVLVMEEWVGKSDRGEGTGERGWVWEGAGRQRKQSGNSEQDLSHVRVMCDINSLSTI